MLSPVNQVPHSDMDNAIDFRIQAAECSWGQGALSALFGLLEKLNDELTTRELQSADRSGLLCG